MGQTGFAERRRQAELSSQPARVKHADIEIQTPSEEAAAVAALEAEVTEARTKLHAYQAELDAAGTITPEQQLTLDGLSSDVLAAEHAVEHAQEALRLAKGGEETGAPESVKLEGNTPAAPPKHGDLDQPARTASTDAWIAYAELDPSGIPFDLTKRTGLRDEIAAHYLGTAE